VEARSRRYTGLLFLCAPRLIASSLFRASLRLIRCWAKLVGQSFGASIRTLCILISRHQARETWCRCCRTNWWPSRPCNRNCRLYRPHLACRLWSFPGSGWTPWEDRDLGLAEAGRSPTRSSCCCPKACKHHMCSGRWRNCFGYFYRASQCRRPKG